MLLKWKKIQKYYLDLAEISKSVVEVIPRFFGRETKKEINVKSH